MSTPAISYCTNVHAAEDLRALLAQLDRHAVGVRDALGVDTLGVGLWLAADPAAALAADRGACRRLAAELEARDLAVVTMNAFPYGGFHAEVVKLAVYLPTWAEPARLSYTLDCARVLSELLPDDADHGSISTLPLGWRVGWGADQDAAAAAALTQVETGLRAIGTGSGRPIVLAVEPEPGCVLDAVEDAVRWLAGRVDPEIVGLCLDTCHLAVSFAEPAATIARVHDAGLRVTKVQASTALEVARPRDRAASDHLTRFAEPRYLHQVRERLPDGSVLGADDLGDALAGALPGENPWRVHFHLPLHRSCRPPLAGTSEVLVAALAALTAAGQPGPAPHTEVETYTWNVMPDTATREQDEATTLVAGITAELAWALDHLVLPRRPPAGTEATG